nr:LLM class flavin-dependent oxidoreductase [Ornithinimicrobium sp. HY1793]
MRQAGASAKPPCTRTIGLPVPGRERAVSLAATSRTARTARRCTRRQWCGRCWPRDNWPTGWAWTSSAHERFATVDALSGGRAEITVGRGSVIESFPLFGFALEDYEVLFSEKLDLLAHLLPEAPVRWEGTTRPVVVAIIGGPARQFAPLVDLYRRALKQAEQPELPVGVHSPGHVAATDEQAVEEYLDPFVDYMNRLGRERGWPPMTRDHALEQLGPNGTAYVGSPETVARKIADTARLLGLTRFQLKYSMGHLSHAQRLECIRLYAEHVAPRVRELLA